MRVREPVVAGQFYPGTEAACRRDVEALASPTADPPALGRVIGGLVPHAGWLYSGSVAGQAFRALAASSSETQVVVLFGGVHRFRGRSAAMFGSGRWETPLGSVEVDDRLAERVLSNTNLIIDDPYAHEDEHSIEVQIPFVQRVFPDAAILPIMVPATATATEVGRAVARTVMAYRYQVAVVGTTDLTHYGPRYGFAPLGVGRKGNRWAKVENDRRFIEQVLDLNGDALVGEAAEHHNACSAGAAAATVAAVVALGATHAVLLSHKSSSEVAEELGYGEADDSVGYAGIVFTA